MNELSDDDKIKRAEAGVRPSDLRFVRKNIAFAEYVEEIMCERDLKLADVARLMEKEPSEVSRMLSGTHNFTFRNLCKLEEALGADVFVLSNQKMHRNTIVERVVYIHYAIARDRTKEYGKLIRATPQGSQFAQVRFY